jgi:hypothetical protein
MVKDNETRALNVLAKATADVTGRSAIYRKVLRVATTKKPEDYDDASVAFDAQESDRRVEINARATARAQEDKAEALARLKEMEVERERANREALEAEKKKKKAPEIRGHVWG